MAETTGAYASTTTRRICRILTTFLTIRLRRQVTLLPAHDFVVMQRGTGKVSHDSAISALQT